MMESSKDDTNSFICSICDLTFSKKANLKRHNNEQHSRNKIGMNCFSCNKYFARYHDLAKHIDAKHSGECVTCSWCDESFPELKALYRHIQTNHKSVNGNDKLGTTDHIRKIHWCEQCKKNFAFKNSLTRHMQNIHKVKKFQKKSLSTIKSINCPLCDFTSRTVKILNHHIEDDHCIKLNIGDVDFDSIDDFKKWKEDVEKEDLAYYASRRGAGNKTYYECHRSGSSKGRDVVKKRNQMEPIKICKNCPARMIVTNVNGHIHVNYQRTHVGHSHTIRSLHLTKEERDILAEKIETGVSFDKILDDIRDSITSEENISRFQLVSKRDLYNIKRCINKPAYQMEKIAESHHRSENIKDNMIENIQEGTWLVKSTTAGREPYTVSMYVETECSGCSLLCPICRVCVHQFNCSCIDHQIGNFCKHVHACIRFSRRTDLIWKNEVTVDFEDQTDKIVKTAPKSSVHVGDSLPSQSRLTALHNAISTIFTTATEEAMEKVITQTQRIYEFLQKHQLEPSSTTNFSNLPSHKSSETVHCAFDHDYLKVS